MKTIEDIWDYNYRLSKEQFDRLDLYARKNGIYELKSILPNKYYCSVVAFHENDRTQDTQYVLLTRKGCTISFYQQHHGDYLARPWVRFI